MTISSVELSGNVKELPIVVKADGFCGGCKSSLTKLSNEEVAVKVIHGVVWHKVTVLAAASNAIIISLM